MRSALVRSACLSFALLGGVLVAHCSGSDNTPSEVPGDDTGVVTETGGDETSADAPPNDTGGMMDTGVVAETSVDTGSGDTFVGETSTEAGDASDASDASNASTDGATDGAADADAVACGTVTPSLLDVYVDKSSTLPSVGTLTCPYHSIKEATDRDPVAGRTIHVKGGTPGMKATYAEIGAVQVKTGITLVGDGSAVTNIFATGTCVAGSDCAVQVAPGATIDGFSITSNANGVITLDGTPQAVVRNVIVHDTQEGFIVLGSADFGSSTAGGNVISTQNKSNGIHVKGTGTLHVYSTTAPPTDNEVTSNAGEGILVEGTARLVFEGGKVTNNKGNGVHLASTVGFTTTARHDISGLTANQNGLDGTGAVLGSASGLFIENSSSVIVRNSVFLTNTQNGVAFIFGGTNTINLGTDPVTAAGGNTFSAPDTAVQNARFGLCLEGVTADDSVPTEGNKWAACSATAPAVPQTAITAGSCSTTTTKGAIGFKKATGGASVSHPAKITPVTGCTVGP